MGSRFFWARRKNPTENSVGFYGVYAVFFFFVIMRITISVPMVRTVEMIRQITAFGTKPAMRNDTNEIAATVMA